MKKQILEYVRQHSDDFGIKSGKIDFFVKNKYRKLTFFLFSDRIPFAIAKFTPFPRKKDEIISEYDTIRLLKKKLPANLKKTIQEAISLVKIDGQPVLFLKFIEGTPMTSLINGINHTKTFERNLKLVTDWLIPFHQCLGTDNEQLNSNPIDMALALDITLSEGDFTWLVKSLPRLPRIPQYTDFWPGNIIIDGNGIKIVDWEDFGLTSLPLFDLFHFIVSYILLIDRFNMDECDKFQRIFFNQSKYSDIIKKAIKRYCIAFNIKGNLDVLFCLYLLEFHNIRHRQEGAGYDVTKRSNAFIKIFLKNRKEFVLK